MYGTLTPDELEQLAQKLSHAGHAFYDSANALGSTALHLEKSGRIEALSPEWNGLWALRQPYVNAMDEMHILVSEVDAAATAARDAEPASQSGPYAYISSDKHLSGE